MAGIGHLLAEGEMQKEAHDPIAQAVRIIGIGGALAAIGAGGYISHRQGRTKAEHDHANNLGENKPSFLSGGLIGQRAYKKRMAELQAEKQAAAIPNGVREAVSQRTKAILIGAGGTLGVAAALGGAGYWAHRRQKRDGQPSPQQ